MEVTLTWYELVQGATVGVWRRVAAMKKGMVDTTGMDFSRAWTSDIEGALGELAAAKVLGVYWPGGVNTFRADDILGFQVRTRPKHTQGLLLRPGDSDEARFLLVTGCAPTYRVHGWLKAGQGKQPQWWRSPNGRPGCWFVPQSELIPVGLAR